MQICSGIVYHYNVHMLLLGFFFLIKQKMSVFQSPRKWISFHLDNLLSVPLRSYIEFFAIYILLLDEGAVTNFIFDQGIRIRLASSKIGFHFLILVFVYFLYTSFQERLTISLKVVPIDMLIHYQTYIYIPQFLYFFIS